MLLDQCVRVDFFIEFRGLFANPATPRKPGIRRRGKSRSTYTFARVFHAPSSFTTDVLIAASCDGRVR